MCCQDPCSFTCRTQSLPDVQPVGRGQLAALSGCPSASSWWLVQAIASLLMSLLEEASNLPRAVDAGAIPVLVDLLGPPPPHVVELETPPITGGPASAHSNFIMTAIFAGCPWLLHGAVTVSPARHHWQQGSSWSARTGECLVGSPASCLPHRAAGRQAWHSAAGQCSMSQAASEQATSGGTLPQSRQPCCRGWQAWRQADRGTSCRSKGPPRGLD